MIRLAANPLAARFPSPARSRPALGAALLAAVLTSDVAAQAAAPEPVAAGSLLQTTLGLLLVLALIGGAAWLAKRFTPGAVRGMPLRIVASQAVGQRERVVVVEVGDQWLVVGVAPGSVRPIASVPRGEAAPASTVSPATSFADSLAKALGKRA